MRIALIIEHFDATRGGAEHFTVWLARQLAAQGHEVHIVCHDVAARINRYRQATQRASHDAALSHEAHPPEEVSHDGLHIHRLRGMKLITGLGFRLFGARARRWCREHQPDVAHSMTIAFPGDIYHPQRGVYAEMQLQAVSSHQTQAAAQWDKIKQHLSGKQRTLLALERRALAGRPTHRPARVISTCAMVTRQLQAHYQLAAETIIELSYPPMTPAHELSAEETAADRTWFRGLYRLDPADKVAAFIGHDFRRKGLRQAIEAVAQTKDWKLLVVGLGKAREYVELADSLGLGDNPDGARRVLFIGPTRAMEKIYAAADALLLPTFYDPFPLAVLEALSHGLPVISTEHLGAAQLIQSHHAGVIVPSARDTASLAHALQSLPAIGTPEYQNLAYRARTATPSLPRDEYLQRLLAVYRIPRIRTP